MQIARQPAPTRRRTIAGGLAALGLSRRAGAADAPAKPDRLTMNVYAGPFEANMRRFVAAPFEAETGIRVNLVPGAPPMAKLQAQGDAPELDVFIAGTVEQMIAGRQGIIAAFDAGNIPELDQLYDIARSLDGVVVNFSALGLAYDTRQWTTPPTSWFALVSDTTPGRIVVRQPDAQNTVAWMAIMARELDGTWPTTPEQYGKVGALIHDHLKPKLAAITTNTASTRAGFTNGGASLAVWTDSQVAAFVDDSKLPIGFVMPQDGGVMIATTAMITRTPHKYWAERLVGTMLRPQAQAGFAANGYYAPSNASVTLDPAVAARMTYGQAGIDRLLRMPWDKITPINQQIGEIFYEAVS